MFVLVYNTNKTILFGILLRYHVLSAHLPSVLNHDFNFRIKVLVDRHILLVFYPATVSNFRNLSWAWRKYRCWFIFNISGIAIHLSLLLNGSPE
jgi:hypothetical protein